MRKLLAQTAVAAIVILTVPVVSQGSPITFELTYSGASFGNSATATGSITFDNAILSNPGTLANVPAAALGISAFSITVSGASSGNGTFGLASVNNWVWIATSLLNLNQNLVGQA